MSEHIHLLDPELVARSQVPFASLRVAEGSGAATAAASGSDQLKRVLHEFGFAVVTGVLEEQEVVRLEGLWADDLRSIVDERFSKPDVAKAVLSDPVAQWPTDTAPLGSKFASDHGLPQGRLAWAVRRDPKVRAVFASLFDTDALCVGTDNIFFNTKPCAEPSDERRVTNLWPHADQNLYNLPAGQWQCYQGVLYLWESTVDSSTTVVWPGSHREYYRELMTSESRWRGRGHFCTLPKADVAAFVRGARRIPVPRGALLLWDSKTIHQGWPCGKRLAVPVCFEPVDRRTQDALRNKKTCVLTGTPTSHWASLGESHRVHKAAEEAGVATASGLVLKHEAHMHLKGRLPEDIFALL